MLRSKENIVRKDNTISINYLDHSKCVSDFLYAMKDCIERGWKNIKIKSDAPRVFPNACVPICGIIRYYESQGITFDFDFPSDHYLNECGFISPYYQGTPDGKFPDNPFDKIILYDNHEQVYSLSKIFLDCISHEIVCEKGVMDGISWCITEVMDNVITHSEASQGLVMAQLHPQTKHIVFCVYDTGVGIYNSLKKSKHTPQTELDSLSLAMQEGVGDGKGQGNGLFGLYQIVLHNHGRLTLTSGSSSIMMRETGEIQKFERIPFISYANKGTTVDFQLDLSKEIDIVSAFKSIGGFDGFDIRIDDMLSETDEFIHYNVYDNSKGTVTREAGRFIRNDIINILQREERVMLLSFKDVQMVSSSFIDELIAKLFIHLGFTSFNARIRIVGMSPTIKFLCERSLYMRIHSEWDTRPIDAEDAF